MLYDGDEKKIKSALYKMFSMFKKAFWLILQKKRFSKSKLFGADG